MPNRRSTSSGSVASQAKARAPVSVQSAPSFSIPRAASATRIPSRVNSRASDALNPSPAPTINAILYFGISMRLLPFSMISSAQSGKAACRFQYRIECGFIGHSGVFGAQHAERTRVIFLRFLGPGLVTQSDAELFLLLCQRLFVGACPRHEQLPDLVGQDRHQGWSEAGPGLECAFCFRPEHAVHPVQHIRRAATDQCARGRISPHFVDLSPQAEIAERRPAAEQIGTGCEM